jgi:hypothetical protein
VNLPEAEVAKHDSTKLKAAYRFIVYSPFSGKQFSQEISCYDGSKHYSGINNMDSPTDLKTSGGTSVYFNCSGNIKSIYTYRIGPNDNNDALCRIEHTPPVHYPWVNEGVRVDLFAHPNGLGYIGSVYYGHLRYRITNRLINNPDGQRLGVISTDDCDCECYDGHHTHMEKSSHGTIIKRACEVPINTSTPIYYFDYDYLPYN